MLLLAVAITWLFSSALRAQAEQDGEKVAESFVTLGVQSTLTDSLRTFWTEPDSVPSGVIVELDKIGSSNNVAVLDGLTLYSTSGEPLYYQHGDLSTAPVADPELMANVLDSGRPVSSVVERNGQSSLAVYVPVTYGDDYTGAIGVAVVELPWEATQQFVRKSVLTVSAVVAVILMLAWLLLYRTVHRASRKLRDQADENERLALHDALTNLPNRRLLNDRLERAITAAERTSKPLALMMLDVDRFKEVNDTLGHDRGDALLIQIALRIGEVLRDADTVARLGGDEFAVLAPIVGSIADAERLARRVHSVFDEPFVVGELVLHVEASLGVAVMPEHAENSTELMQRADTAMYAAKATHVGVLVYTYGEDGNSTDRLVLLGDLRSALGTGQLSIHYQPKVNLDNGQAVGMEALLRWAHPTRGNIPPNDFIPLAERTGLIHGLTRYVLEMVMHQMSEWDRVDADFAHLPVAVNLSARNLLEPSFADFVEDMLASHQIEPERLELEVTESALIEDPVRSHEMLHKLAGLGVSLAVDDFGTGYTSMAQLEAMPLTTLKIDRSFVVRLADDPGGATLVKAMVDLAHEFGLEVVAEGVEDEHVTQRLRELGCDVGQGFLWSRPVASDVIPDVLFQLSFRRARIDAPAR
ncbi:MAG TPA: EAL domain-containing protein [Actinomycetes bacterium]|nr:EAL domain-containing protein [Actinomycetes bacterium]